MKSTTYGQPSGSSVPQQKASHDSLPAVVARAAEIADVTWAIGYLYHEKSGCWLSVATAGALPAVLRGLSLPGDRLPATVVRALEHETVEHSRLFPAWIEIEAKREVTEEERDALSSIGIASIALEDGLRSLLLVGYRHREPDLAGLDSYRRAVSAEPAPLEQDVMPAEDDAQWARSEPLITLHHLLARNIPLFHEFLRMEIARAIRYRRNLSLLTFTVVDLNGGPVPDDVVVAVAGILRSRVRPMDIVGRALPSTVGMILPETSEGSARWISPRLRLIVARYLSATDGKLTVEVGSASKPRPTDTPEDLITLACRRVIAAPLAFHYRVS